MKIAIASDHAGYRLKQTLKQMLIDDGHEVVDFGTHSEQSTDYPKWIRPAAEALARGEVERAIVLGGSGNGEAMVANRVKGVRCGYCFDENTAYLTRLHNDANCIAMGQRIVDEPTAMRIVKKFLETEFEGGRNVARVRGIDG